jgi:hypothetical protein
MFTENLRRREKPDGSLICEITKNNQLDGTEFLRVILHV